MKLAHTFCHLVFPRQSNNHKAKLLHSSSILGISIFVLVWQLGFVLLSQKEGHVLGYKANISPDEVVLLTNEKRTQMGLSPLVINQSLSQAALAKGEDMLSNDYWAHVSPTGTQPWKFFADVSYKYKYAGENLARDFSNPLAAVNAWMASPSHKENLLSTKYKEIGIGVVEGDLAGVDTTIIVQLFGTQLGDILPVSPTARNTSPTLTPFPSPSSSPLAIPKEALVGSLQISSQPEVLVSPFNITKSVTLGIVGILALVLFIDFLVVSRRKIVRISGRPFAHLAFLGMILAIALIVQAGRIL